MSPVLFIVIGVTTEYDEHDTWNVAAYPDTHMAEIHAQCAQHVLNTFLARYPEDVLDWHQEQWALMRLNTYGTAPLRQYRAAPHGTLTTDTVPRRSRGVQAGRPAARHGLGRRGSLATGAELDTKKKDAPMDTDLHPWPRCGSRAVGVVADDWNEYFHGECAECAYEGPEEADWTSAHDAWNAHTLPKGDTHDRARHSGGTPYSWRHRHGDPST